MVITAANNIVTPQDVLNRLGRGTPVTVRRVLPQDVIENHIKYHMRQMQTMMKSFQAILTFPTPGRRLPQVVLAKMHNQFSTDLRAGGSKLFSEIKELRKHVEKEKVLQSHIMLNTISEGAFPFCMLNEILYHPRDNRGVKLKTFVPCYVILWARQPKPDDPVHVWLQLDPLDPEKTKYIPRQELKSEEYLVRLPVGEVHFHAFDTAVSLRIYDEPNELEATFLGKDFKQLMAEYIRLRSTLLRRQDEPGNFMHILWAKHELVENDDDELFMI